MSFVCLAGNCKQPVCEPVLNSAKEDAVPLPTRNIETDIYLDGTLSMQGFTTAGLFSYYQQTIPILERAALKSGKSNFFKFGNVILPLSGRSYADAANQKFYSDKAVNSKTYIENIITNSNPEHLTVIVTDLYQDKADINQLVELIKSKYIVNNLAVGIMTVKSQFKGNIHDVGVNNHSFLYPGKNEENASRPFYILTFGPYSNINQYYDSLEQFGLEGFPDKQRIIFSRYLLESPPLFSEANFTELSPSLTEVTGVLVNASQEGNQLKELKIKSNTTSANFVAVMPIIPALNGMQLSNNLVSEIKAATCTSSGDEEVEPSFIFNSNLSKALKIDANLMSANQLQLKAEIQPDLLEQNVVNCFHITVRPADLPLPNWIADWNMDDNQVENWWTNNKANFDGSKTYNLEPFLLLLWQAVKDEQKPKLGDFYCYFKRG